MCPTSQRGGKTLPGLEKRPGPGLQWIYSPRGMCLACPGSGQRRGRGQERHGPEWRTGRITHQAETVPGQGGVKSPLAGLTLVEGKGLGELMPGPPRWGFTDSLVVGAPGRQGTCGVTEDRRGGRVPPVSGAWSWIWAGGGWLALGTGRPRYRGILAPDTRVVVCPSCASCPHVATGPRLCCGQRAQGARVLGL